MMSKEGESGINIPFLCGLSKFWRVYNGLKVELFGYLKHSFEAVRWEEELVQQEKGNEIYAGLLDKWQQVTNFYQGDSDLDLIGLKGVFYEALFYYCVLKQVCLFRQSAWLIREGWMNVESIEPEHRNVMWLEIVPIFEVMPRLLLVEGKRVAPQVGADFFILYATQENQSPIWFIDVKSSAKFLNRAKDREQLVWQFTGANYYGGYFQVAFPKETESYPEHLRDWLFLPKGEQNVEQLLLEAKESGCFISD
jgi:hypothetical protein